MKTAFALLTVFTGLAFNAQAGGLAYPPENIGASSATRAEVRAELDRARSAGEINHGEETRFADNGKSSVSRAAVRADLARARSAGAISFGEPDYQPARG